MVGFVITRNPARRWVIAVGTSVISAAGALMYLEHLGFPPGKPDAGLIQELEHFRGPRRPAASVVIVDIKRGASGAARAGSVRRAVIAQVIRCASAEGAKAIAILSCLEGPSPFGYEDDLALIGACRAAGNVVLAAHSPTRGLKPHAGQWSCVPFASARTVVAGLGEAGILTPGGTGWTVPTCGFWGSPPFPGICVETVRVGMRLSSGEVKATKDELVLGTRVVDLSDGELIVNFRGPRGAIPTLDAGALLGSGAERQMLKEAYVVIGEDSCKSGGLLTVPLGRERGELGGTMGPVEILANGIETLAGGISIRWVKLPVALAITLGECLLFASVTLFTRWVVMVLPVLYGLLLLEGRVDAFFFTKSIAMDTNYRAWAVVPCVCLSLVARIVLFLKERRSSERR